MIKKILLSLILSISLLPIHLHANADVSSLAKNWFYTFSKKISIKYSDSKEILYFEGFSNKLSQLLTERDFNNAQTQLINDLIILINLIN